MHQAVSESTESTIRVYTTAPSGATLTGSGLSRTYWTGINKLLMYTYTPYIKLFLILIAAIIVYLYFSKRLRKYDRD